MVVVLGVLTLCGACTGGGTSEGSASPEPVAVSLPAQDTVPAAPSVTADPSQPGVDLTREGPLPAFTQTLHASPDGTGDCSVSDPCAVVDAFARATGTSFIALAPGTYDQVVLDDETRGEDAGALDQLVLGPEEGADVSVAGVEVAFPGVRVRGMTSTGALYLYPQATDSGFAAMTVTGASTYMTASGSYLVDSTLTPAIDRDALQIKAIDGATPERVVVENNVIGPTSRGPERVHVDCIQVLGVRDLKLRLNTLFGCASQGLLIAAGATGVIEPPILVERNVIQLCPARTDECGGYNAVLIDTPDFRFVHNTVVDGGSRFDDPDPRSGVIAGNRLAYLATCEGDLSYNVVEEAKCSIGGQNLQAGLGLVGAADSGPPDVSLVADAAGQGYAPDTVRSVQQDVAGTPISGLADAGALERP